MFMLFLAVESQRMPSGSNASKYQCRAARGHHQTLWYATAKQPLNKCLMWRKLYLHSLKRAKCLASQSLCPRYNTHYMLSCSRLLVAGHHLEQRGPPPSYRSEFTHDRALMQ